MIVLNPFAVLGRFFQNDVEWGNVLISKITPATNERHAEGIFAQRRTDGADARYQHPENPATNIHPVSVIRHLVVRPHARVEVLVTKVGGVCKNIIIDAFMSLRTERSNLVTCCYSVDCFVVPRGAALLAMTSFTKFSPSAELGYKVFHPRLRCYFSRSMISTN